VDNLSPQVKVEPVPLEGLPLRRSSRVTAGQRQSTRYVDSYLATVMADFQDDGFKSSMAYKAELQTDFGTGLVDIADPRVYAARFRSNDTNFPSFFQTMH
jgi:hypothetical protein